MVLKEKEDLCNWFKVLQPRKRIDYMCGLLHLCLPLELRFIGTVLEDIAKINFNVLREAENKANNPIDIASNDSNDFSDHHFRSKTLVNLALMHSANSCSADIIFKVLEKQFSSLTNDSHDEREMEEVLTILTLACHHPAFNFSQRLRLVEVLKSTEEQFQHHWENPTYPQFSKNSQSCMSVPLSRSPKVIASIVATGIRDEHQNKKSGPDYEINVVWSNGELTQHLMKHKELQNLHNQIFNKFVDEKKLLSLFPTFTARRPRQDSAKEEKISSMNAYLSELSKAHHIISCDILTRAFQNGKPVQNPMPVFPAPSPTTIIYPATYMHYQDNSRIPYCVIVPPATARSSSTNSPNSSRPSSPNMALINSKNVKLGGGIVCVDKIVSQAAKVKGGLSQQQQQQIVADLESGPQVEICQLLKLLGLEKYSENLSSYSIQEVCSMNTDALSKLGLPLDAQRKLQSKLDQPKHNFQDANGVVQLPGPHPKHERPMHSYSWQGQGHLPPDPVQQQPPSHQPHVISQVNAMHPLPTLVGENSPNVTELSARPLSPGLHSITDSPPSSLASPTSVYLEEKSIKNQQVDSSGSEDDKVMGQGMEGSETSTFRKRGPSRPLQSLSLPLINHSATHVGSVEKVKVTGVPASISAPVMNSDLTRDGGTPPMMQPILPNGYISEGPFFTNTGFAMPHAVHHQAQQQQQHRYKSAQPTHTGPRMHKNVVNMPCPDRTSQLPPTAPSINKNNGNMNPPIMHPTMLHHHQYILPPNLQTNPGVLHQPQPANGGPPPQQLPGGQPLMPPGLGADNGNSLANLSFIHTLVPAPNFIPPHSRGVLTTIPNNTSGVMSSASSHLPGQHQISASHSPSPVASSVSAEQGQINFSHSDGQELRHEDNSHNKSSPANQNTNSTMSHIGSKAGSGTPSPPLASKQNVTTCHTCDSSNHPQPVYVPPLFVYPSGNGNGVVTMPPYSTNPHQQNSLQHFPNGISPDVYLSSTRFPIPIGSGQFPPVFYGSQALNPHPMHHSANNGNLTHHTPPGSGVSSSSSSNSSSANNSGNSINKSTCYNCGQQGHKGNECKEMAMENMTNSYRLDWKPKVSDSE